jgi:hypothetical protein
MVKSYELIDKIVRHWNVYVEAELDSKQIVVERRLKMTHGNLNRTTRLKDDDK